MDPFLDEERPQGGGFDPLAILRMFWRRKWLFFVPFVICLAMAFVAVRTMTPVYEATGQVRVVAENPNSRLIEDDSRRYRRPRDMDRETLANIWTIVTAPKFLEAVVRETRYFKGPARMPDDVSAEAAVLTPEEMDLVKRRATKLARLIRVRQDGYHIFELGVRSIDPRDAFVLSRVVLDRFLQEERSNRLDSRSTTRDFLTRQKQTYTSALLAAEDSLSRFQATILNDNLVGNPITVSSLPLVENNLIRFRDQYYNADVNEMAQLEQQARAIIGQLPDVPGLLQDADFSQMTSELAGLVQAGLLTQDTNEQAAALGRARVRLNTLSERHVENRFAHLGIMNRGRIAQYVYFMVYRAAKQRAMDTVAGYIQSFREFTNKQPLQSARLEELENEVSQRRQMLESIEREITQQTINLEASLSEIGYRIEVRRDPELPDYPVEPDKLRLYFMGVVLSVALGMGLVVLSIMLDRTFTSVEEIERSLGLKVVGTLPVIHDEHFKRRRRLRLLRWVFIVVAILAVAAVFLLYVYPRLS